MATWGSDETFFDDVERDHLDFLKANLPHYLAFHELYCGFLPENFNGAALAATDVRAQELRRLGFLSYSILINALLVHGAAASAQALTDMLSVYARTSGFFLRAGAVIDISIPLDESQARIFHAGRAQMVDDPGGTPRAGALKRRLFVVDQYNNFLKHNGLPAVRLAGGDGAKTVQIPEEIPMRGAVWNQQNPNAPLGTLLGCYAIEIMQALDAYYAALVSRGPGVLGGWGLTRTASPAGIRTVLKQAASGSLPALDGYQSSAAMSHFWKWG